MTRITCKVSFGLSIALIMLSSRFTIDAFAPAIINTHRITSRQTNSLTASSVLDHDGVPYFADETNYRTVVTKPEVLTEKHSTVSSTNSKKGAASGGAKHKEGIMSPLVWGMKLLLGEPKLNKIRGQVISMHSDVIGSFVNTAETPAGNAILKKLFELADRDNSGTIDKEELSVALHSLGFEWLMDKQVEGIFERADQDHNGAIEMDEWMKEAPKTLRTNLVKLAKKNGGELGFLV